MTTQTDRALAVTDLWSAVGNRDRILIRGRWPNLGHVLDPLIITTSLPQQREAIANTVALWTTRPDLRAWLHTHHRELAAALDRLATAT